MLHSQRFRRRNLNLIHVSPVPEWLEDSISKSEDQQILNRLFAEVVVNPVNLRFVKSGQYRAIQLSRGFQVPAKRLFDDDPRP